MTLQTDDLSARLRRLSLLAESGEVRGRNAERLAVEAERALRLAERDQALLALAELLNGRSRWETAGAIADGLRRFEQSAWPRILRGDRSPRGGLENLYVRILANGGVLCRRSVWDALRVPPTE